VEVRDGPTTPNFSAPRSFAISSSIGSNWRCSGPP